MPDPQAETRRAKLKLGLRPGAEVVNRAAHCADGPLLSTTGVALLLSPQLKETAAATTAEGDELEIIFSGYGSRRSPTPRLV
jgi:hypothetical protein